MKRERQTLKGTHTYIYALYTEKNKFYKYAFLHVRAISKIITVKSFENSSLFYISKSCDLSLISSSFKQKDTKTEGCPWKTEKLR